ncbi:MAG: LamG domain-containing protein [Patescibacteria group bacterium]
MRTFVFVTGLIFTFLIFSAPQHADAAVIIQRPNYLGLTSGLVGFWSFDGNAMGTTSALDTSVNANHGWAINGPKKVIGRIGQALEFDGVDGDGDFVGLANPTALQLTGSMTISAWTYLRTTPPVTDSQIVFKGNNGTDKAYGLNYSVDNGPIQGRVQLSSTGSDSISRYSATTLALNSWYHVVGVYNAATLTLDIYINGSINNGTLVGSVPASVYNSTNDFSIGRTENSAGFFDGLIDDVRVYNRALSADEIKRLYRIGATLKVNAPRYTGSLDTGLVGSWSFDGPDMAGTVAYDRSGNANNGTLTGAVTRAVGRIGQGMSFDGVNDYVVVANESNFDFERTSPFSGAMWLKANPKDTTVQVPLVKSQDASPYTGWQFVMNLAPDGGADPGKLRFDLVNNISTAAIFVGTTNDTKLLDDNWHHYVFTTDGSGASGIKIYEDGVQLALTIGLNNLGANSILNNQEVGIGAKSDGAPTNNEFYNGSLDDVRVYNRALSVDEIKRLYRIGATLKVNAPRYTDSLNSGLVGFWSFDGNAMGTTSALDTSGNANHGWAINGPKKTIGRIGQAMEFDGADDFVIGSNNAQLPTGDFTYSIWFTSRKGVSAESNLISINTTSPTSALDEFQWELSSSEILNLQVDNVAVLSGVRKVPIDGTWVHAVITRSGSAIRQYINGLLDTTGTGGTVMNFGTCNIIIGIDSSSSCLGTLLKPWKGLIDDVRVYNRALSADEIRRLYNIGR